MKKGIIGKDVAGNDVHDMVRRIPITDLNVSELEEYSESEVTTSSWKDVRQEVKRWCDEG